MTALSWASFGLLCSLVGLAHAVVVDSLVWALIQGAIVGLNLAMVFSVLRNLLRDLRRRELMRRRRVLALRGFANAIVWDDRSDPSNPRHHAAWCAQLAAYRALDELVSVRASMGSPA